MLIGFSGLAVGDKIDVPGDQVTKGQVIAILEAMKMENEIVAPQDGVIATIDTSEGASVEAGAVLATMN